MPKDRLPPIFIGIGGHALCLDAISGEIVWKTKLKSTASFITMAHVGNHVYAGAGGEVFCLDARSGATVWNNKLKGLGTGLVSFTGGDVAAGQALIATAASIAAIAAVSAATV